MTNNRQAAPIGVFDSGVGGISVLGTLTKVMPNEDFIYFGDSANAPYGEKSGKEVCECAHEVTKKLLDMDAKAIVIACNTATSAGAEFLRKTYPDIPIVGMEPAVKPAALSAEHPTVLVMATPLTIRETKLRSLMDRYRDCADFIDVPCHGLVELVERGITEGGEMDALLADILAPHIRGRHIDAAVLGCTHYIHAKDAIRKALGDKVAIFDGALGTARETLHRLEALDLVNPSAKPGSVMILNSSNKDALLELSRKLLINAKNRKE